MEPLYALPLGDILRNHARSWPAKDALVCTGDRHSYPAFDERVSRLANALTDRGVTEGDRVLWLGQNCHRLLEGLLAAAKLGAVFCPANWRQSAEEFAWLIGDVAPRVVLWQEQVLGEVIGAARAQAADDAHWIGHDDAGDGGYEAILAAAKAEDPDREVDPSTAVLMMYTAAFGGRPQGALLTHTGLIHQGLAIALVQNVTHETTYLNSGPLFHVATFMTTMATLLLGGRNVFTRKSDAEEICRLVDAEEVTAVFLVPPTTAEMAAVNADGRYDLSSLVTMRTGDKAFDAMISPESTPWHRRPGGYGQTEVAGLATFSALGGQTFVSGRPSPVATVRIADPDGRELPVGEVGEIVVRGPIVMAGYHARAGETARRQRGGWHHTDDLGRREADGTITFIGPKTKLVKTGAENVYPAEVEACLQRHPAVQEAAVIGVPDPTWGQNVKAVVVLRHGGTATAEELIEHCRTQIASYKKPKIIEFAERLPRTGTGQLDRDEIDAAYGGGGYPGRAP